MDPQDRALRAGVDIVVATPGRLMDHMRHGWTEFGALEVLVLDEADRMIDMGFLPDVRRILEALPATRQTLLFSATMPAEVLQLHTMHVMPAHEKVQWLARFSRSVDGPALVFVRTKIGAERLARELARLGVRAVALARRSVAGRPDGRRRGIPERPPPAPRRDRPGRPRPRHRGHHARRELRRARFSRELRAPRRPDGP
jgi:ATP-dependent RNA helicase RhlE